MGGPGSGREPEVYSGTVEQCRQLDVNRFVRDGYIKPHNQAGGTIAWGTPTGKTPPIEYEIQCFGENGYMRLQYRTSRLGMDDQVLNYNIELMTTKPNFGGLRWWFVCPNEACNRMVVKLYQPGVGYFLCRTCHKLTYQSCRDSGKRNLVYEAIAKETGLDVKTVKKEVKKYWRGMYPE